MAFTRSPAFDTANPIAIQNCFSVIVFTFASYLRRGALVLSTFDRSGSSKASRTASSDQGRLLINSLYTSRFCAQKSSLTYPSTIAIAISSSVAVFRSTAADAVATERAEDKRSESIAAHERFMLRLLPLHER